MWTFKSIIVLQLREHIVKDVEYTMNTMEDSPVFEVYSWIIGCVSFSLVTVIFWNTNKLIYFVQVYLSKEDKKITLFIIKFKGKHLWRGYTNIKIFYSF